jgi:hypothetical protein
MRLPLTYISKKDANGKKVYVDRIIELYLFGS